MIINFTEKKVIVMDSYNTKHNYEVSITLKFLQYVHDKWYIKHILIEYTKSYSKLDILDEEIPTEVLSNKKLEDGEIYYIWEGNCIDLLGYVSPITKWISVYLALPKIQYQ